MYKSDRNLDVNSHLYRYWISAAIDAASGIVNNIWGSVEADEEREFNAEQAKINRQFQRNERLASQEFELDMWNRNNEYNDIGSQIARARAAGVNPAAILNGEYKSATSAPVTTDAAQGSQASSNTGFGAALAGKSSNLADGVASLMNSGAKVQEVKLNEKLIDSNIQVNGARLKEILTRAGVNDATEENIRASTYWMHQKTPQEIQAIVQDYTKTYNENFAIFQQIRESRARTANYEASTKNIDASTRGINIENAYKPAILTEQIEGQQLSNDILAQQLSQEELKTWELNFQKDWATSLNMPLNAPEFQLMYALAIEGRFGEYCSEIITPSARAAWKPADWNAKGALKAGVNVFGLPLSAEFSGESSFIPQAVRAGSALWNSVFEKDGNNKLKLRKRN